MSGSSAAAQSVNLDEVPKSKKPTDSAFKQQRLPAWQPILTAGSVLPTFFVIGVAFVPIGIGMFFFSQQVREIEYVYTDCKNSQGLECATVINGTKIEDRNCHCAPHDFEIDEDWEGEVFIYYGLENFYQNHRRYVKSRDDNQLLGDITSPPDDDCFPFRRENATSANLDEDSKFYLPCGAIANSLFSDVITLSFYNTTTKKYEPVPVLRKGIAWASDKKYKFKNPPVPKGKTLKDVFQGFAKPKDWKKNLWELDPTDQDNNGLQNEDLIVWMRTAALPNFRKLYRKIDHSQEAFKNKLPKMKYRLDIEYNFEVKQFSGSKSVILSTTSLLGGKNSFLGVAYIVVGCICFVMGVILLFVHIKFGKQTSEMMKITSSTPFSG